MFKRIKNLDPMTRSTYIAASVEVAIGVTMIAVAEHYIRKNRQAISE